MGSEKKAMEAWAFEEQRTKFQENYTVCFIVMTEVTLHFSKYLH
jgi:hypothetical protein